MGEGNFCLGRGVFFPGIRLKPQQMVYFPHIFSQMVYFKAKFYWNLPYIAIIIDLVGGWPTPLKNHGVQVSWDDEIPNWMEKKRFETDDEIPNKWKVIKFPGSNQPTRSNMEK